MASLLRGSCRFIAAAAAFRRYFLISFDMEAIANTPLALRDIRRDAFGLLARASDTLLYARAAKQRK